jgi:hypothetical protein
MLRPAVTKETRNLLFALVGLVCFAAMTVWSLSDSSRAGVEKPSVDAPPSAPPPQTTVASAKAPAAPAQPAPAAPAQPVDLFAGDMPDFMAALHSRVLAKQLLDVDDQKQLYEWGRAHRDDARPQLLLAWDSMNREWDGIAIRMYRMAYRADKRAKDDPSMLRDLMEVGSRYDTVEFTDARNIIAEAYGAQAVPQINAKIDDLRSQGKLDRASRLERLRTAVLEQR